ncbi:HNH endonuclease signature motif containing protein [Pseudofrankia saprophytica]|uniref:HNH endonuclease signature motif containing protein n=1 Tax=Pseudofrankia saprophytica TaxID=298655 RepID=UPI001E31DC87|nr:HNH endonuclease signature motif containing protein [Pseudofrankia saprophytica]
MSSPSVLSVDVEAAPLEVLEGEIVAWAGRLAAATCGWLVMVAAFDRRGGWSGQGFSSCAHWLAWRCGLAARTAREHLSVGHALETLPAMRAAFAAGRLSYSKVRAVTRVAEPDSETAWLNHALCCTAAQLERLAATCERLTGDHAGQRAGRRVSWRTGRDGMLRLSAVLPADEGAQLVAAIDAARASLEDTTAPPPPDETDQVPADGEVVAAPRDRRLDADALVTLANGFLDRPAPGLLLPSHTVTVHVDADTLLRTGRPCPASPHPASANSADGDRTNVADAPDAPDAPETPDTDQVFGSGIRGAVGEVASLDGPPGARRLSRADVEPGIGLPMSALRRLGCDGLLRALLSDAEGNPLHLGRRRRLPNRRLRDAVYARDLGTCQYPGCERTRWLQIHHLTEWSAGGGATDIGNLTILCTGHHHAVHDEGIILERGTEGAVVATLPDGRLVRPAPVVDPGRRPIETLAAATRHLDDDAILARDGGRLNLADSICVLTQHQWNEAAQRTHGGSGGLRDQAATDHLRPPAAPEHGGAGRRHWPTGNSTRHPVRRSQRRHRPTTPIGGG